MRKRFTVTKRGNNQSKNNKTTVARNVPTRGTIYKWVYKRSCHHPPAPCGKNLVDIDPTTVKEGANIRELCENVLNLHASNEWRTVIAESCTETFWLPCMSGRVAKYGVNDIYNPYPTLLCKFTGGIQENTVGSKNDLCGNVTKRMLMEMVSRCIFPNSRWNGCLPVPTVYSTKNKRFGDETP